MAASISSVLQFWKNFNLSQLQRDLDINATELAGRQDASDVSRRKLVEQSKEFKRVTPEDVRKSVAPLLRSFQSEIDALSKRSKASEADFLNLYKKLVDLPDPVLAFEQAEAYQKKAQRLNDVETENQKLRETLAEYNKEFAEVKNQEVTIKTLREKVREFEKGTEDLAKQLTFEKNEELQKHFTEKEKKLQETQLLIATKLGEAEQMAGTYKSALDASQAELFDLKSKYDEEIAAKQAELDLVSGDLDRMTQRMAIAEKEIENMKENMSDHNAQTQELRNPSTAMEEAFEVLSRSSLEAELSNKEKEISQLVEDVQHLQGSMGKLRESSASAIAKLEEELAEKNRICQDLQRQVDERDDYDEIKRELQIIKSTEFASLDSAASERSPSIGSQKTKSLEMLLMEKNRTQQSENTALRAANAQLTERCEMAENESKESSLKLEQQQQLIQQLEQDLITVQGSSSTTYRSAADGAPNPAPDLSAELMAGALKQSTVTGAISDSGTSSSLLAIVTSQRERFRVKNQELEAENYMLQQNYNRQQNELDQMRTDNVKLYEKIKFLQSYPATKITVPDDVTSKRYSSQYEENLDPFTSFNKREKQRKYMNLSPHDKLTLNVGKFILSSKMARTVFFIYMLIVHCLLYVILYKYAYTEDCMRHIAELCYEKFGQQMVPNQALQGIGGMAQGVNDPLHPA